MSNPGHPCDIQASSLQVTFQILKWTNMKFSAMPGLCWSEKGFPQVQKSQNCSDLGQQWHPECLTLWAHMLETPDCWVFHLLTTQFSVKEPYVITTAYHLVLLKLTEYSRSNGKHITEMTCPWETCPHKLLTN